MKDLLYFDNMLTPKLITFVYWVMLFGSFVGGLGTMFGGFEGFTIGKFFLGMLYALGGALASRIWCELLIVLFKMNEALQALRQK
ncbi:DUF4282 domain-containing protein [Desulfuromonas sp. KJ2020]|uniref:DUF4282 domain-containing protein n=1 Tax=Desulfuromonas sp. KJ2020 TaxID=2919173 RepID=UPI0020A733B9|nr:DUF4282 domain-containing protein [Desulfuromonas sp. KJ2020]MCP3176718.1 DUF4282 domain-containing protein [Desulfuromonas sp. KJ2020]